jgi:hypothetical protein
MILLPFGLFNAIVAAINKDREVFAFTKGFKCAARGLPKGSDRTN